MGTTFENFFCKLFQSDGVDRMERCLHGLEGRVTVAMNESLLQDFF